MWRPPAPQPDGAQGGDASHLIHLPQAHIVAFAEKSHEETMTPVEMVGYDAYIQAMDGVAVL